MNMKKIQVLGTGCPKCKKLYEAAREAAKESETEAEVVKVEDMNEILQYGVMMTPALAVDGQVKSTGKVLSSKEIAQLLA